MLDLSHDLDSIDDAEEVEELAMTSLAKLVFVDTHSRSNQNGAAESESDEALSLAFENLFHMPFDIIETYGSTLRTLDISYNEFSRNLHFLAEFDNVTSLNLDHNNIDSYTIFPPMPKLQLLWLNHNKIEDLYPFVKNLHASVPNLRYLCIMGNKAAPSYLNGGSFYEYLQSRLFVISWFPHLVHLDDRAVTPEQRLEAKRLFKRPLFDQIAETTQVPECLKHLHNKMSSIFSKPTLPVTSKLPKGPNFVI
ncbi:leucine-rich melanocyte differentiation-associated protein-like isoform X1 [Diprion similis]|uniref:leucine-rich melanocyte differentiation-associated protein-like isoform X1 n=2 Tax=Diprion similis TaxID=362088 RepID=UPI001EF897DE|nr:leucine-rich melanocyte differentiation-associated protein-like isoform X1 [Diprion similis]